MSAIIIRGGRPLSGSLTVQGAKNSVLPILAATLLSGEVCRIRHCPRLRDVETAMEILRHLGCRADWQGRDLLVDAADLTRWDVPDHLMSRMRSSVVFLGAILARCGQAEMTYPGGCELGARPIDLHLAGFRAAIEAGVASVMPYYSIPLALDTTAALGSEATLQDLLRDKMGLTASSRPTGA